MYVEKNVLAPKLARLKNAVPSNKASNFSKGILFHDNTMTAANELLAVTASSPLNTEKPFVLPNTAVQVIDSLPDIKISLESKAKNTLSMTAGAIKNRFQCDPVESFPTIDLLGEGFENIFIPATELLDAISSVLYTVPSENTKTDLTGILFEAKDGILNLVGCDGYRCAWAQIPYEKEFRFILPKQSAKCLESLGLTGDVEIEFNYKTAAFKTSDYTVISRLLGGLFIEYHSVFPKQCKYITVIERNALSSALHRASICTDKKPFSVILEFNENILSLSANSSSAQYHEDIAIEDAVGSIKIAFNIVYLLEAIKNIASDKVSIGITSPRSPMLFQDGDFKAIVLPVRLKAED